ncbi:MAG: alpha-L-fucosidase [Clostridia bacterium]|nr:alpha-L-fucosidase [Clostridia bacterium]
MANMKKEQLEFLDWEFGVFLHFGIRTFNEGHRDWDMKNMELSSFNPTELDCEQWIRTIKEAGAKYAILVCKHHDGFANWPSDYTDYSVKNTPWKDGKGDIVKEYTKACRKYGLKVGLYYSPAQFGSSDMNGKEYDDYFVNQITELLTNYGKIDYIWFDGCGSEDHKYDTDRIVAEIRRLQPGILIFNMWDPDTKWVGNEAGCAHSPNKLTVGALDFSINKDIEDLLDEPRFLPSECDFRMRSLNWFYSEKDEDTVKSLDELMGLYYYSVGRSANFLINIGPDRRGLLPEKDSKALLEFGKKVKELFSDSLECDSEKDGKMLTLTFETPQLVNHVILTEEIDPNCEIESYEIRIAPYPYGRPVTVFRGTTIGHKSISSFPTLKAQRIEIYFDKGKNVEAKAFYIPRY